MKTGGRWCCICLRVRVAGFLAIHVSSRGQALKTRWNLTTFKSIFFFKQVCTLCASFYSLECTYNITSTSITASAGLKRRACHIYTLIVAYKPALLKVRTPVRIRTGREFNPDRPPLVSLRPPCGARGTHTTRAHGPVLQCLQTLL